MCLIFFQTNPNKPLSACHWDKCEKCVLYLELLHRIFKYLLNILLRQCFPICELRSIIEKQNWAIPPRMWAIGGPVMCVQSVLMQFAAYLFIAYKTGLYAALGKAVEEAACLPEPLKCQCLGVPWCCHHSSVVGIPLQPQALPPLLSESQCLSRTRNCCPKVFPKVWVVTCFLVGYGTEPRVYMSR